jgi:hypothetical protein
MRAGAGGRTRACGRAGMEGEGWAWGRHVRSDDDFDDHEDFFVAGCVGCGVGSGGVGSTPVPSGPTRTAPSTSPSMCAHRRRPGRGEPRDSGFEVKDIRR